MAKKGNPNYFLGHKCIFGSPQMSRTIHRNMQCNSPNNFFLQIKLACNGCNLYALPGNKNNRLKRHLKGRDIDNTMTQCHLDMCDLELKSHEHKGNLPTLIK